ncbi:MAG: hypothetical protein AAF500_09430 [Myxococcota bacterium]
MAMMTSTVLTVTDLTMASYPLVKLAAAVAKPAGGEVLLVSTRQGRRARTSEPGELEPSQALPGTPLHTALRHEGQLLEKQREWCARTGVRCSAELLDDGHWPNLVLGAARRAGADLILLREHFGGENGRVIPEEMQILAHDAPCPISWVRLPPLWGL